MQSIQSNIFPSLFGNYEIIKLPIAFPSTNNLLIYLIILVTAIICSSKHKTVFLDKLQTDQLKGVAILLIVISHLWFHVSKYRAIPMVGDYSVSLFLMLSGFGLTKSLENRPISFGDFMSRRLMRVMLPYWIFTIMILILDYFILTRSYSLKNIMLTMAGINLNPTLRQLDYARWFITLLLIYYGVFFLANRFFEKFNAILLLIIFGLSLMLLKHYGIFHIGKYNQEIAFPVGCLLAYFHKNISYYFNDSCKFIYALLFISLIIIMIRIPQAMISNKASYIYNITELCIYNATGLLFCVFMIMAVGAVGAYNYVSKFFLFCGAIAYEIYLIHGPLLIKYNPFLKLLPITLISLGFFIYLASILMLSFFFNRVDNIFIPSKKTVGKP